MRLKCYLLIVLIIISCDAVESKIYGCLDPIACNYNSEANISDYQCEYIENECGICGGDLSGVCSFLDKPQYTTKESCELAGGKWIPNCGD